MVLTQTDIDTFRSIITQIYDRLNKARDILSLYENGKFPTPTRTLRDLTDAEKTDIETFFQSLRADIKQLAASL